MILIPPVYTSFDAIVENHTEDAQELLENALAPLEEYTGKAAALIKWVLSKAYSLSGGLYQDEIARWAKALEVGREDVVTANVGYELAQAAQYLSDTYFPAVGCTSVVLESQKQGFVHVRNMDWDLAEMGHSTLVRISEVEDREVVFVTNPGFVGVLSGMATGEFSVTLNWAPPSERPRFDFGPVFLLRWVLENATDFDDAVAQLSTTPLSSPALFTVCGIDNACVVERTCRDSAIRRFDGNPLVVTNHYLTKEFEHLNDSDYIGDSDGRYKSALRAAKRFKGKKFEDLFKILSGKVCRNDITVQQMIFAPAKADYSVWAYDI